MQADRPTHSEASSAEEVDPAGLEVAQALQELRERIGSPSLGVIGQRSGIPKTTLYDLLAGNRSSRPRWGAVRDILLALVSLGNQVGIPLNEESEMKRLYALWNKAMQGVDLRDKENVADSVLISELNELYIRAGRPSLRVVSDLSKLPRSTLHEILSGRRLAIPKWDVIKSIVVALKSEEPSEGAVRDLETDLTRFYSLWQREQVVAHRKDARVVTAEPALLAPNVILGERATKALADIKRLNGLSDIEAINRAVLIAQFIDKSLADGFEIFMQKPGEESQRIVIP
ncbi:hypothetical protein [Streptosporangium sp. NPDC002721]|uniref:hypothetical protein n=1 Tax=Streptosporangium sp. NPDC002721 TaxID=3366188 RepID=UPI0036C81AC8